MVSYAHKKLVEAIRPALMCGEATDLLSLIPLRREAR